MKPCLCAKCNSVIDLDYENVGTTDDQKSFICQKCWETFEVKE